MTTVYADLRDANCGIQVHVYDAGADPFGNLVVPLPNPPPGARRPSEQPLPEKVIKPGDDGF